MLFLHLVEIRNAIKQLCLNGQIKHAQTHHGVASLDLNRKTEMTPKTPNVPKTQTLVGNSAVSFSKCT